MDIFLNHTFTLYMTWEIKFPNFHLLVTYSYCIHFVYCQSLHTSQMAHQARAYLGSCSMKWLGVFLLRPGWNANSSQGYSPHPPPPPSIKFAGNHLYTWVERGTVRVKCLAKGQNAMSLARPWTRTTQSSDKHTNHEAGAPKLYLKSFSFILG